MQSVIIVIRLFIIAKEIQVKQYKNIKSKSRKGYQSSEEDLDTRRRMEIPADTHLRNTDDMVHNIEYLDRTMNSWQRTGVPSAPRNTDNMVHKLGVDNEDLDTTMYSWQRTGVSSAPRNTDDMVHKLGTDTLTTLGRVNTARVIIERLLLTDNSTLEKQTSSRNPR